MGLLNSWRYRPDYDKEAYAKIKKFKWTIYGETKPELLEKKWNAFHYVFKYKLLIPILYVIKKFIKPQRITDEPHNFNLKLFDDIFEQSIWDWNLYYQSSNHIIGGDVNAKLIDDKHNSRSSQQLRQLKDIMLHGAFMDTAYREFLNILIYNLAVETKKVYDGQKIVHLFYNRKYLTDLEYRAWWHNNHAAFVGGKFNGGETDGPKTN